MSVQEIASMLKFTVLVNGRAPADLDVAPAYLLGPDEEVILGRVALRGDTLLCEKRVEGLAALVIPWSIPDFGRVLLSTTLLPERDEPYNLTVELLRGRVIQNWRKKDDWGYAYTGPTPEFLSGFNEVKKKLAQALSAATPAAAADLASEGLQAAVLLGEDLTLEHAKRGLIYRRSNRELVDLDFGCRVELSCRERPYQDRLFESFNYAALPMDWRAIEGREQEFHWRDLDYWVGWLREKGLAIKAGQVLRFSETTVPDWLYIWEDDFESIRDHAFEHVLRCVRRYGQWIEHWDVAAGLNAENCLKFTLDQIIELTHMSARVVKKHAPQALAVLDVTLPWGEYAAAAPRSISPLKYVEMCVNTGVEFDAIGLEIFLGAQGYYSRDLLAVSALLDLFGSFGKPVHITAAGVPSSTLADVNDTGHGRRDVASGGVWHRPWDQTVQSEWVDSFYHIAVGKPFVTSVCWTELSDRPGHFFPHAGLLDAGLKPKGSYAMMLGMKKEIWPEGGLVEAELPSVRPDEQWKEYK
jgi:hypothetical protein